MTTLQGGLLIAALIEIAIGAMGLIGVLLKQWGIDQMADFGLAKRVIHLTSTGRDGTTNISAPFL